jgi:hypothetical protein
MRILRYAAVCAAFAACAAALFIAFGGANQEPLIDNNAPIDAASLALDAVLLSKAPSPFPDIRDFFVSLADRKGAVYAYALLREAELPPGIDIHLLGHAIGDELFKQEGLGGMGYCTQEFRNACSHSIVVGALLSEGMGVFERIHDVCKSAPGGAAAYAMCFHGFGHGVLAYADYDMPEAVALCGKVGTAAMQDEEAAQCIGGAVMEMHYGINDLSVWEKKRVLYVDPNDPLALCAASYMPEYAKVLCYEYLAPYIFDAAGAIDRQPRPDIFAASFAYCDPLANDAYREACYAGIGKEFIGLLAGRDIRSLGEMTDTQLTTALSWCALAGKGEAAHACVLAILDALYWGGENDPSAAVRLCSLAGKEKASCFTSLFGLVAAYPPEGPAWREACAVAGDYAAVCVSAYPRTPSS